jgi:hypothetical protein
VIVSPSKTREYALAMAQAHRPAAKFTRVSKEFIDAVEAQVKAVILQRIKSHPTIGITLR